MNKALHIHIYKPAGGRYATLLESQQKTRRKITLRKDKTWKCLKPDRDNKS